MKEKVNIFGCCISRESFILDCLKNHYVGEYIHKGSVWLSDRREDWPQITEDEVVMPHNFLKRSICTLLNGTSWDRLYENRSSWLILDNYYFTQNVYVITPPDGGKPRIMQFPGEIKKEVFRIVRTNPKYSGYSIKLVTAWPNYPLLLKSVIEKLKPWAGRIIFLDAVRANYHLDQSGSVVRIDPRDTFNRHFSTKLIVDALDCYYVSAPDDVYSNYYKSCDKNPVHYGKEVYEYYSKAISMILNSDKQLFIEQQKNYLDLQVKESSVIFGHTLSESYLSTRILNYLTNRHSLDDADAVIDYCNELIESNPAIGYSLLGRLYREFGTLP